MTGESTQSSHVVASATLLLRHTPSLLHSFTPSLTPSLLHSFMGATAAEAALEAAEAAMDAAAAAAEAEAAEAAAKAETAEAAAAGWESHKLWDSPKCYKNAF